LPLYSIREVSEEHRVVLMNSGSLYLSETPKFYTKVLHQTLNPTAELWCKTLSLIMFDVKPGVTPEFTPDFWC